MKTLGFLIEMTLYALLVVYVVFPAVEFYQCVLTKAAYTCGVTL